MTCIVGAVNGKGVVLGSDSLSSNGFTWSEERTPKLFRPHPWLALGYTTSWRWGQILGQMIRGLRIGEDDPYEWMLSTFVPAARQAVEDGGWKATQDGGRDKGGTALVALKDRLFLIQDDWAVLENATGIDACGSGEYHALTAMRVGRELQPKITAQDLAELGLRHAELAVTTVRGPFHFVETA